MRHAIDDPDRFIAATQLGITIASLGLGWIGEPVFVSLLEPLMRWLQIESPEAQHSIAFAVGFSVMTFLHIVAGELAPKSLAILKSVPTALWVAIPLDWFYRLTFPLIWVLNHTANWLLRRFGIEPASEGELDPRRPGLDATLWFAAPPWPADMQVFELAEERIGPVLSSRTRPGGRLRAPWRTTRGDRPSSTASSSTTSSPSTSTPRPMPSIRTHWSSTTLAARPCVDTWRGSGSATTRPTCTREALRTGPAGVGPMKPSARTRRPALRPAVPAGARTAMAAVSSCR